MNLLLRKTAVIAFRRLAAWTIDWAVIAIYGVILFVLVSPVIKPLFLESAFTAQATGFFVLTLPVFVYFSATETIWGGTLGKRLLKLRIRDAKTGQRASGMRIMLRNVMKFAPWELAHFSIWNVFIYQNSAFRTEGYVAIVLAYGLAGFYLAGLFFKNGHTLYDVRSGLHVEHQLK